MVRATCVFVAIFCLIQGFMVCSGQDWRDHDHDDSKEEKHGHKSWGHKGSDEDSWEKPWGDNDMMKPWHDDDDWSENFKNMDWAKLFKNINLKELLEDEEMMKIWSRKDWDRMYEKIREFMRSKHAWRHVYREWGRHRGEDHHRRHLALLIAAPICGVILLAIVVLVVVKCVKKSKRNGQKGRVIHPVTAVPPPPALYLAGEEEKKLTPEQAFGPAFGPGVIGTAPPLYTLTVPEEKKPEV